MKNPAARVTAIIVAAGKGKRFGGLKQFINIRGKPLIYYTLKAFDDVKSITGIVIVVPRQKVKYVAGLVFKYRFTKIVGIVPGGRLRQDSVLSGLKLVDSGIVAIHDAVRPFITRKLILDGINFCRKHKAVIFGLPVADTIKKVAGNRVVRTVDRKGLYIIQTPQFFDVKLLKNAYRKVKKRGSEYTDDAAVVENYGRPVYIFPGLKHNIKITFRDELYSIDKSPKSVIVL